MDDLLSKRGAIVAVIVLLLGKLYLAATLQLHPDEAYYWLFSRHLDFGYFDHPPLVAYCIRLTTLVSQQELWVRFSGILETVIVSALAWVLSLQLWNDRKIAAASVITLNTLPLTLVGSVLITPDIPVFLFVSAGIVAYWQIVASGKARYWYVLGAAFGLALLSKYTAFLLAPPLLLFTIVTDERKWLKTVHPYAGFLLGCIFFLPVVYWNSTHEWASFAFQLHHGLGGTGYRLRNILAFCGGQMLVAGPIMFVAAVSAAALFLFQKNKEKLFLSLSSLFVLLFFTYSSLKRTAAPNWPVCAYFTLSILVCCYLFDGSKVKKRVWVLAVLLNLVLSVAAGLHTRFNVIPLERIATGLQEADATNWFYGWKELARELERDPAVKVAFADTSQLAAEITYYTRERIIGYVDRRHFGGGQYGYWDIPGELRGTGGVCISYREGFDARVCSEYFASLGETRAFTVIRDNSPVRTYHIVRGERCACTPSSDGQSSPAGHPGSSAPAPSERRVPHRSVSSIASRHYAFTPGDLSPACLTGYPMSNKKSAPAGALFLS